MGESDKPKAIIESYNWLEAQRMNLRYGELGISFIIHDGCIVKIIKKIEEKQQAASN